MKSNCRLFKSVIPLIFESSIHLKAAEKTQSINKTVNNKSFFLFAHKCGFSSKFCAENGASIHKRLTLFHLGFQSLVWIICQCLSSLFFLTRL